tara:strand:- start:31 stop:237 length:207 start_codon:yes stop_codon:yes gene_type:complete
MKNLLQLLNRYADENGVEKLGDLLDKNGYDKEYLLYLTRPELIEYRWYDIALKNLVELLESNLEELPF